MKDKAKTPLERLEELCPETAEVIAQIAADKAAGFIPESRRTYKDCRSWPEAWVFVFELAGVHYENFLKWENKKIVCVVWSVADFDDRIVDVLGEIADRIGPNNDLIDMRIIGTKVTPQGAAKLKIFLPKATVNFYSPEDAEKDETLEYVNTRTRWIEEMHAKKNAGK